MKSSPAKFNAKRNLAPRLRRVATGVINIRRDADVTTACHKILAFIKKVDRFGVVELTINTPDGVKVAAPAPAPAPAPEAKPAVHAKTEATASAKATKAAKPAKSAKAPKSAKLNADDLLA